VRTPWIVGVSGASGTPYARAVLTGLLDAQQPVDLIVSRAARLTILDETGLSFRDAHWAEDLSEWLGREPTEVRYWSAGDLAAGPASGSYPAQGMVVVPASTAAVAGIALGLSKDLLQRAADVTLKERRPLILCVRETPFNLIHLRNMTQITEAGGTIYPVIPTFYNLPSSVDQVYEEFTARLLGFLGLPQTDYYTYSGDETPAHRDRVES